MRFRGMDVRRVLLVGGCAFLIFLATGAPIADLESAALASNMAVSFGPIDVDDPIANRANCGTWTPAICNGAPIAGCG